MRHVHARMCVCVCAVKRIKGIIGKIEITGRKEFLSRPQCFFNFKLHMNFLGILLK